MKAGADAPPGIRWSRFPSRFGEVLAAAEGGALVGLWFVEGQKDTPAPGAGWARDDADPVLAETRRQFGEFERGERRAFDLPLSLRGTGFQRAVWAELLRIPFGATSTYGEVARRVGRPAAVRAVGAAVGRNPVSVIVPCHRVLGADGSLTGYAGGLGRKRALLSLEGVPAREPTAES